MKIYSTKKKTGLSFENLERLRQEAQMMRDKGMHFRYEPVPKIVSEAVKKGEFPWIKMEDLEKD